MKEKTRKPFETIVENSRFERALFYIKQLKEKGFREILPIYPCLVGANYESRFGFFMTKVLLLYKEQSKKFQIYIVLEVCPIL